MNSFIKYIPESLNQNKAFVDHLLSIIDTKLQFSKHQVNALITSFSTTSALQGSDTGGDQFDSTFSLLPSTSEKVFSLIEQNSKTTNLLLILRTRLTQKNVSLVYDLLSNDRYLEYESKDLENLIEKSRF